MKFQVSPRDLQAISLYLDDQLNPAERQRLEKRLQENEILRQTLAEMRQARLMLRHMSKVQAPRNFTLAPQQVGMRQGQPGYPILGFISALAGFLFVLVLAGDLLGFFRFASQPVALQSAPVVEATASTLGIESQESEQAEAELFASSSPAVTQALEAQTEMKAAAPPAEAAPAELPMPQSAILDSEEGLHITATPALQARAAKEAPAQAVSGSETGENAVEIQATEMAEKGMPASVSPTVETVTLSPQAETVGETGPSQPVAEETSPTEDREMAQAEGYSVTSPDESAQREVFNVEANAEEQVEMPQSLRASNVRTLLWLLEVILAGIAVTTAGLFYLQRRKSLR